MTSLREFLMQLSIDPMRLAEYIRDPTGSMASAGLDEQSRRVLRSGSPAAMWEAVLGQPGAATANLPPTPPALDNTGRGSLVVVGTGIRTVGHLTLEAIAWIKESDV